MHLHAMPGEILSSRLTSSDNIMLFPLTFHHLPLTLFFNPQTCNPHHAQKEIVWDEMGRFQNIF